MELGWLGSRIGGRRELLRNEDARAGRGGAWSCGGQLRATLWSRIGGHDGGEEGG